MALGGPQMHVQLPHLPHSQSEPSKLCQLRERYQQRQLADKEQRLLRLFAEQRAQQERAFQRAGGAGRQGLGYGQGHGQGYGSAGSSSSNASQSSQSSLPYGKVRQLFEGRRQAHGGQGHGAGRDRGLPLAPLERPDRPERRTRAPALATRSNSNVNLSQSYHFGQPRQPRGHSLDRHTQGSWAARGQRHQRRLDYGSESSESEAESPPPYARTFEDFRILNRLPNVGGQLLSQSQVRQRLKMKRSGSSGRYNRAVSLDHQPAMAPPGRLSVPAAVPSRRPPAGAASNENAPPPARAGLASRLPAPARKTIVPSSPQRMSAAKAAGGAARGGAAAARPEPRQDDGLTACPICARRFLPDRVAKHQEICSRSTSKKRKVFDPVAARVKGTEAEKYVRRAKNVPEPKALKNNNWRRKHEDFIQTIRAAKQVQSHIASGGKLSDLPPPPPSDYSDYVPCPHCGRKFNQTAAERHIPKCATMLHNKPKAGGPAKPTVGRGLINRR